MKKTFKAILCGSLAGLITVCAAPVIADSIEALMNSVNINLNGKEIASVNENYVLQNGTSVPYSILYEGTTYLPIRKISEILNIEIDWDNSTRTVLIEKNESNTDTVNNQYDSWYGAPDFGEFSGIEEIQQSATVHSTTHWYSIDSLESDTEKNYQAHLEQLGYERVTDGEVKPRFKIYKKDNIEVWLDLGMYTKLVYGVTVMDTTRPVVGREYDYNGSKENIPDFETAFGFSSSKSGSADFFHGDWYLWSCLPDYFVLLENEGFSVSNVDKGFYGKSFTLKKERSTVTVRFDGSGVSDIPAVYIYY